MQSIRNKYSEIGVKNYYQFHKSEYKNPHEVSINKCLDWVIDNIDIGYFLDLASGNGEVSNYLSLKGFKNFKGCDPYFKDIYELNTKSICYDSTFEDISKFGIPEKFDTIFCSYALHLCQKSYYKNLLYNISISCNNFVVVSPSKYPTVDDFFRLESSTIIDRTHCRIFKSFL